MPPVCPKCGNDIYKPYMYCNACSWDADDTDHYVIPCRCGEPVLFHASSFPAVIHCPRCHSKGIAREIPQKEEEDEIVVEMDDDDEEDTHPPPPEPEEQAPDEDFEPYFLPCKCGASIKVTTSKRPLRITCDRCGRKGTLKEIDRPPTTGDRKPDRITPCPKCGADVPIFFTEEQTITIKCPACGTTGNLKNPRFK